jgi:hypothetical protein
LNEFWDEAKSFDLPIATDEPVSGAAFCKARKKLPPEVIRSLVHQVSDRFDKQFGSKLRWHERRVFAVDGTKINVQRHEDLAEAFGVPFGGHCPQILASTLFELTSKVPYGLTIGPNDGAEREQLFSLLDRLHPGDILVLDRGYPSFEVMRALMDAGVDFVMRVTISSGFNAVEHFLESGREDGEIVLDPPSRHLMRDRGPIKVRALRVTVPDSKPTVLLTSLRGAPFSNSEIREIYRRRWEIEEYYKLVKGDYFGQGQFHAKSPDGVRQEVFAVTLFVAITRYLMAAAARVHKLPYSQVTAKSGVLAFAAYLTRLLLASDVDAVAPTLDRLLRRIVRIRYRKRPGRRFRRRSFKPKSKWCGRGKRGRGGG